MFTGRHFSRKFVGGSVGVFAGFGGLYLANVFAFQPKEKTQAFSSKFVPYTLGEVVPLTHDTALFRFIFDDLNTEFNLKPCSTLQAMFKGPSLEQVHRFYTPVTANHTKGYFELIVKRKPNGRMTEHLFGMHIGDKLNFRSVSFKLQYEPNKFKEVGMICAGSGFTPMLQVIRHALCEFKNDKTKLSLLFCNRSETHILLKGLFDYFAKTYPERFRVAYTIDCPVNKDTWKGYTGYVTKKMVQETMPPPSPDNIILVCGPDNLLHHVAGTCTHLLDAMSGSKTIQPIAVDIGNLTSLGGILLECGYNEQQVYRF